MKLIKDITPPLYVIDNTLYNEYEVRELQAQIAEGKILFETVEHLVVKEVSTGIIQQFRPDGRLWGNVDFEGFNITTDSAIRVFIMQHKD